MTYQKAKEEIVESSPQKTDAGKEELYLYSLRKMAEENVENNRTGLTNLHNINSFFYLCGEMIKQQPDKKYGVIIMDIVQFKAVNEFCGRDEGDRLLRFIASCFDWYENNRPDSYACHIRADIFCLCTSYEEVEELEIIVREIRKKITDLPCTTILWNRNLTGESPCHQLSERLRHDGYEQYQRQSISDICSI